MLMLFWSASADAAFQILCLQNSLMETCKPEIEKQINDCGKELSAFRRQTGQATRVERCRSEKGHEASGAQVR
jgi:hypothetical protein